MQIISDFFFLSLVEKPAVCLASTPEEQQEAKQVDLFPLYGNHDIAT